MRQFIEWNFNIDEAPRGQSVVVRRKVGKNVVDVEEHQPEFILASSSCGKVLKSYWIPPVPSKTNPGEFVSLGRFSGFTELSEYGSGPVAWAKWPKHPTMAEVP